VLQFRKIPFLFDSPDEFRIDARIVARFSEIIKNFIKDVYQSLLDGFDVPEKRLMIKPTGCVVVVTGII